MTTSISLVIPSVNRPVPLAKALASVAEHGHGRVDVLVVAREEDIATQEVATAHGAQVVTVALPGLAHAMQAGARAATTEVVAFTDDDAELLPGWLERMEAHYADPAVGGVGGRDVQLDAPSDTAVDLRVGTVRWYGKVVGGHHTAIGPPRTVDHLKGVNCSFRRTLFTARDVSRLISGTGAQSRNELVACLSITAHGARLVFDPELQVLHSPAPRVSGDERGLSTDKVYEAVHNECLAFFLAEHPRRWFNGLLLVSIGYRSAPGLLRLPTGVGRSHVRATLLAVLHGSRAGARGRTEFGPALDR